MTGTSPASRMTEVVVELLTVAQRALMLAIDAKISEDHQSERLIQVARILTEAESLLDAAMGADPCTDGCSEQTGDASATLSARTSGSSNETRRRTSDRVGTDGLLRGPRTQEYDFYVPILATLVELGGHAPARQVLEIGGEKLRDQFTPEDLRPIPSVPDQPRWDKTANWARQELAESGLIVRPAKRGIWTISDAGRTWLAEQS